MLLRKVLRGCQGRDSGESWLPPFSFFLEKKWSRPVLLDWVFNFELGVDLGELHSYYFLKKCRRFSLNAHFDITHQRSNGVRTSARSHFSRWEEKEKEDWEKEEWEVSPWSAEVQLSSLYRL